MPSVSMPGFVHRHTPFAVTLEGAPSQPLYLCVSIQLGYAQWASPPFEMALIAKLANGLVIPLGPLPASGSLVLSASLPSDETLLGVPLVVGHAATLIGMP
jgi:hypothetical protein